MPRIQGVGPRLSARLLEMGFRQATGKPDAKRFARVFDYDKTLVYEWLADRRTPTRELDRLCADLQVTHGWLLYEEGKPGRYKAPVAIGGGSGAATGHGWDSLVDPLPLIRHWLSIAWGWLRLDAPWAFA